MMLSYILSLCLAFARTVFGSFRRPYATYRRLVDGNPEQLLVIFSLIALYFFFVSPLRLKTFHPFLLTVNTTRLFTVTLGVYIFLCFYLLLLGKLVNAQLNFKGIMLGWGYSLVPTLLWFLSTSLFYVILPPPRHETMAGRMFSLLYITLAVSLFAWKGILYYLTLRFALKLDLGKILVVSSVFLPTIMVLTLILYSAGIFRVPFI